MQKIKSKFSAILDDSVLWRLLSENMREQMVPYTIAIIAMVFVAATTAGIAFIMRDVVDSLFDAEDSAKILGVSMAVFSIFPGQRCCNLCPGRSLDPRREPNCLKAADQTV